TRGGDAELTGGAPGAPATFSIAFRALVETTFLANGDAVGQGDTIGNSVAVGAAVVGGLGTPGDTSAAAGVIAVGSVAKSLYAVNGAILPEGAGVGSPIQIASGDLITFRLKYTLPQGIVSTLILTDFLPLPVFDVDSFTLVVEDTVSAAPPPENILRWGPDAVAFDAAVPALPVVSSVSAENKLVITFIGPPAGSPPNLTADVLFTVRVIDKPFGDGLMLTNQVTGTEINANSTISATSNALAQVTLTEPTLRLTKGVINTDQPVGVLSPTPVGPVSFTSPGTPGVRFAGEIDSIGLAARPVNSDLSNIDGSDLVSFAIVVENIGTGKNGAFDISVTDTLPPGFAIPPGGLNLQVTDGARTHITFVGDLFGPNGITLVDGAESGALKAFTATGGENILVITYDLITSDQVQPRTSIENIATIKNYASFEGGVNRVPNTQVPTSDNALTRVADPTFEKSVFSTNVGQTGKGRGDPTLEDLTIGEQVTFDLVATLRDGLIRGFEITDTLPAGRIEFVSATMQFAGADLFAGNGAGGTAGALAAPTIIRDGNIVRFVFAEEIVNLATNQTAESDVIRLRLTGVVTDAAGNTPGTVLTNNAALQFDLGAQEVFIQDDAKVEVVGPDLAITKTPDRTVADAGDIVTYTVVATARDVDFTAPAFDVLLRDALPSGLFLVAGSATLLSAPAGTPPIITEDGNEVRLSIPELKPGETIRFTYQARLADTVGAGEVLTNTVALKADSFPGTPPLLPGGIPGPERS
ncbi:MAG: hypothetical protein O9325_19465, partial [Roseomonas sp.]|nr:hypothetical protein [Roseomonas sp.]